MLDSADDFVAWLKERDPSTAVGEAGSCTLCPLATYLRSRLDLSYPAVGLVIHSLGREYDVRFNPAWMEETVAWIDRHPLHTPITAGQLLAFLGR